MTEFYEFAINNNVLVLVSIFYTVTTVIFLAVCVCCRKNSQKNDLLGVVGNLKIKNPDENVNHLPSVGKYISQNKDEFFSESFDKNKRHTSGSNPHRSLPDIPVYLDGENGASGDTCSDLYATVDDKKIVLSNGINSRDNLSDYSGVKENPYDRLKKENPYAKVIQSSEASRGSTPELIVPGPSNTTAKDHLENNPNDNESEIHAAVAVAGRVAASHDLPYMTPPIDTPGADTEEIVSVEGPQVHFSGDSQDSSKGYTSISVREPLEHIRKQTTTLKSHQKILNSDPHYATVSDDSDDNMYAAIVEPPNNENQLYNSGSETYAQIQPITVVEVHNTGTSSTQHQAATQATSNLSGDIQGNTLTEMPGVSNIKHVTHVHSRQASSSSCTSSIANVGSPKPEKRQANSPLPPPPAISSPDVYAIVDKSNTNHKRTASSGTARNLEDMYAKVQKTNKNKKNNSELDEINVMINDQRCHTPDTNYHQKAKLENRQSWSSRDSQEDKKFEKFETSSNSDVDFEHCYETLDKNKNKLSPRKSDISDIGYERIRDKETKNHALNEPVISDIGYERIGNKDPGYEQVSHSKVMRDRDKIDPGYEELSPSRISCETDPNYEILRPKEDKNDGYSSINNSKVPTYSVVNKKIKHGYQEITVSNSKNENVSARNSQNYDKEPGYEEIMKNNSCGAEIPNYEELSKIETNSEPNYESMPYIKTQKSSDSDFSEPNYESVKYLDVSIGAHEPPYEKLNDTFSDKSLDLEASNSQRSSSQNLPGYEFVSIFDSSS